MNFGFSDEMELIVRLLLANRWMVVAKTSKDEESRSSVGLISKKETKEQSRENIESQSILIGPRKFISVPLLAIEPSGLDRASS